MLLTCWTIELGSANSQEKPRPEPKLKHFKLQARASEIDSRVKSHPEIGFVLEAKGKPADIQRASVDTRVAPRGKLMIWLMSHNSALFDRVNSYGIHAIQGPLRKQMVFDMLSGKTGW